MLVALIFLSQLMVKNETTNKRILSNVPTIINWLTSFLVFALCLEMMERV